MNHNERRIVEWVRLRLAQAARETAGMSRRQRSEHLRAFWLNLPMVEAETWRRCVLWPGHRNWETSMTPAERVEQCAKISEAALAEDRTSRARAMWARRSKRQRRAVGKAISVGLNRFWATATLEQREAKTRAALAAVTAEQRSAWMKAWRARQRKGAQPSPDPIVEPLQNPRTGKSRSR
jgi:hypothetical protein